MKSGTVNSLAALFPLVTVFDFLNGITAYFVTYNSLLISNLDLLNERRDEIPATRIGSGERGEGPLIQE